jgi:hypothetical protein
MALLAERSNFQDAGSNPAEMKWLPLTRLSGAVQNGIRLRSLRSRLRATAYSRGLVSDLLFSLAD